MTWPETLACQTNVEDKVGMRLREIQFSFYSEENKWLSGLMMTNCKGQESDRMGETKLPWEAVQILDNSIEKILVYKYSDEWLTGFKIFFRGGHQQLIGSELSEAGTAHFE